MANRETQIDIIVGIQGNPAVKASTVNDIVIQRPNPDALVTQVSRIIILPFVPPSPLKQIQEFLMP